MSTSLVSVRFPSGTILYSRYLGVVDVVEAQLAKKPRHRLPFDTPPIIECEHDQEEVEVASSYSGGSHWMGFGCEQCRILTKGRYPFGPLSSPMGDTYPDDEITPALTKGLPDWWPIAMPGWWPAYDKEPTEKQLRWDRIFGPSLKALRNKRNAS